MTRIPAPLEENEQRWLFQWAADAALKWPELELMHAIPNGGKRDRVTAAKLKGEGVKPGIPDIFLPVPRGGFHGLYIELKRTKGGRPSEAQKDMIPRLREQGYRVEICKGFNAAADVIEEYLGSREQGVGSRGGGDGSGCAYWWRAKNRRR